MSSLREQQLKKGVPSIYDRLCLQMSNEERHNKVLHYQQQQLPYVIRLKIPEGTTVIKDLVKGTVTFPNKTIDVSMLCIYAIHLLHMSLLVSCLLLIMHAYMSTFHFHCMCVCAMSYVCRIKCY